MAQIIKQKVTFHIKPEKLYDFYMTPKLHALLTEDKVNVQKKAGTPFSAFNKYIRGKILYIKPGEMVVQTWRCTDWERDDPDSILVLIFTESGKNDTVLELVQVNVPDEYADDIKEGWKDSYWNQWRRYIRQLNRKKTR
ncbi:MAG: SRPBCC domain-containing protein [Spirochaetales bacterium]|nr:SRPBCC domain-containing protein [Spirochaetales bacterium]